MLERKANLRHFSGSSVPLGTPRGKFLTSKFSKEINLVARNDVKGIPASFSAPGLKEFEEGYELIGLDKKNINFQNFYQERGIDYVIGVINRFEDEGKIKFFNKNYREALKFKEKYKSRK